MPSSLGRNLKIRIRKRLLATLTFLFLSAAICPLVYARTETSYPQLFFEYGQVFDRLCPADPNRPITPVMKEELRKKISDFQKIWDKESLPLMNSLVDLFGKGFGRKEETVSLVLCGLMPPMSHPLMFRIRDYLWSSSTSIMPDFYFVSEVFHEMLHRYMTTNFPYDPSAPLLALEKKYEKEDGGVQSHIYLLAVQKFIYEKLGKQSELKKIIEWDSGHAPSYKRAWDIVNAEGSEKFIQDLKKQLSSSK